MSYVLAKASASCTCSTGLILLCHVKNGKPSQGLAIANNAMQISECTEPPACIVLYVFVL